MKATSITSLLRVPRGKVRLGDFDPAGKPGFADGKGDAADALVALALKLSDLQERLYADAKDGGKRSILLVLQGMDTSGKGGVLRHAVGLFDPQGVSIKS